MSDGNDGPPKREHPTRWKKGCASPNPSGRPPKRASSLFGTVDSELANFLAADRKVVGKTEDGTPITRGETLDLSLVRSAITDPRFMKLYLERKNAATSSEREVREASLIAAMKYQDQYLIRALQAERLGKRFLLLPHPADIEIDGLSVRINGPVTEMDRLIVEGIVIRRDALHASVSMALEATHLSTEERRSFWEYLRRQHYRLQSKLPRRLKKQFPAWVALPRASEDDEPPLPADEEV